MHRVLIVVLAFCAISVFAQAPPPVTASDYARAEKFMGYNVTPLVDHGSVRPNWLPDNRFWYRDTTAQGTQVMVVDAASGARTPAFDHSALAAALSSAAGTALVSHGLPFTEIEFSDDRQSVSFNVAGKRWKCARAVRQCV